MRHERGGFWYSLAVAIVKPPLLLFTRRDWRGAENVPRDGGVVLAVNHISQVDPLTFAHFLNDACGRVPRFLAKESLFRVPFVGRVVRGAGQIPVYRESRDAARAFRAAVEAIHAGRCVIVYPEGSITRDPDLWPMVGKTGAARIALSTGAPVVPVAQWGANHLLAPYTLRPHLVPRRVMKVVAGPPVDLSEFAGQPLTNDVLRRATDKIMDDMTSLLARLREGVPPARRFDPRAAGVPSIGRPVTRRARREPVPEREQGRSA